MPALARSLKDPEPGVRLAAVDALENIGNAQLRLKNRMTLVPVLEGDCVAAPAMTTLGVATEEPSMPDFLRQRPARGPNTI